MYENIENDLQYIHGGFPHLFVRLEDAKISLSHPIPQIFRMGMQIYATEVPAGPGVFH